MTLHRTQHDFTLEKDYRNAFMLLKTSNCNFPKTCITFRKVKKLCEAMKLPFFLRETSLRTNIVHGISHIVKFLT